MKNRTEKLVIGRKDKVDFPKLNLFDIDAKIDTGAYTTSIHCNNVKTKKVHAREYVIFELLDSSHSDYNNMKIKLPIHKIKNVKNSFGHSEKRFIVKTEIIVFGEKIEIEMSLSDRTKMQYPVLIGRKLLDKKFIVDVSKVNLSYRAKKKKKKEKR
ncbi:MAG: ATP-dependent zinc protease family protein [Thermodesulfobacteriota bacterium]